MIDLAEWLDSTAEKRQQLLAYSLSAIPTDPGNRQLDVSEALIQQQNAGDMLADVEQILLDSEARAVFSVRTDCPEMTAAERRTVAKGRTAAIARLRDGLHVLYTTLKARQFSLLNLNRSA